MYQKRKFAVLFHQHHGMKLSVIIVNYNVKYFLEQCLHSVRRASQGIECEVIVVDNNSVDGSQRMLEEKFPEVILLTNKENLGFARANNQGIKISKGQYVLLLNPDTIVEDDTFKKVLEFMDAHPDAGGLGVKMVNGKGKFLPESKRGLPTPAVAFYKISGLSKLFPYSRIFGQYHLSFLDKDKIHRVDILSGAFMLLRRSALEKTGLLDENFFMYGEDIDLSYRLILAGYNNYYFPEARIIHYKGESTKKSSINYVLVFYQAMIIFARKHFSHKNARIFSFFINSAIWFRAGISIFWRFIRRIFMPFADATLIYTGIYFIKRYWENNIIYLQGGQYPPEFMMYAVPAYIFMWLISTWLVGGYDKPVRLDRIVQGMLFGTLAILVIYGLLSEQYRFSRAIIILGSVWGLLSMSGLRLILHLTGVKDFRLGSTTNKRYLIVGESPEAERVADLLRKTELEPSFIGLVGLNEQSAQESNMIGNLNQINDIIQIYGINELVFCSKDVPARTIIDLMSELSNTGLDFKIAPPESLSIIGSKSINTSGDLYMIEINSISRVNNKRIKRLLDIILAVFMLFSVPVAVLIVRKPGGFIRNIFQVLAGVKSWVGYCKTQSRNGIRLPSIKPGVLNPVDALNNITLSQEDIMRLNILYSRNYSLANDIHIILKGFRDLGRS